MTVLFIGPLPDPITGHSLACKVFLEELQKFEEVEVINVSKRGYRQGVDSLRRVYEVLSYLWQAWWKKRAADILYLTTSESVAGNLKDLLLFCVCFRQLGSMAIHLHGGAGMRELLHPRNVLLRGINAFFLRRLGAVIVLGERQVDIFSGLVSRDRIHVVPNFAEDEIFVEPEHVHAKFTRTIPLRILFLSNLLPGKGHEELLEAYRLVDETTRARLEIDFAGAFQSAKEEEAFRRGIEPFSNVRFHGVVRGQKKVELFQRAHVFCLPTYYPYEGQPISILEAYAAGCAVITTDHSGIFDIFRDGHNGYAVQKRSGSAIRSAIGRCLADFAALEQMALANLQYALENHRTGRYNQRLLAVLQGLHQ